MNFLYDGTENMEYEYINITILYGQFMSVSLIIIEVNYGDIDSYVYTCYGYHIIKFSSSPYTFQADSNIYGQVISSV